MPPRTSLRPEQSGSGQFSGVCVCVCVCGWVGGWVGGWVLHSANPPSCALHSAGQWHVQTQSSGECVCGWVGGWVDGWVGGWVGASACAAPRHRQPASSWPPCVHARAAAAASWGRSAAAGASVVPCTALMRRHLPHCHLHNTAASPPSLVPRLPRAAARPPPARVCHGPPRRRARPPCCTAPAWPRPPPAPACTRAARAAAAAAAAAAACFPRETGQWVAISARGRRRRLSHLSRPWQEKKKVGRKT